MSGKGDTPRPVDKAKYDEGYDRINWRKNQAYSGTIGPCGQQCVRDNDLPCHNTCGHPGSPNMKAKKEEGNE